MEQNRDSGIDESYTEPPRSFQREIDCAGEPRWMRQQPDVVVRQRVTIVEPRPPADPGRDREGLER